MWRCVSTEYPGCVLKEGLRSVILTEAETMAPLCQPAVARPYAVLEPEPGSEAALKGNAYLVLPELGQSLHKLVSK